MIEDRERTISPGSRFIVRAMTLLSAATFISIAYDTQLQVDVAEEALRQFNEGKQDLAIAGLKSSLYKNGGWNQYFSANGVNLTTGSIKPETLEEISSELSSFRNGMGASALAAVLFGLYTVVTKK